VLGHGRRDLAAQRLKPLIGVTDLNDEVAGYLLATSFDRPSRTYGGQQPGREASLDQPAFHPADLIQVGDSMPAIWILLTFI
jgi:hypothetical protein